MCVDSVHDNKLAHIEEVLEEMGEEVSGCMGRDRVRHQHLQDELGAGGRGAAATRALLPHRPRSALQHAEAVVRAYARHDGAIGGAESGFIVGNRSDAVEVEGEFVE